MLNKIPTESTKIITYSANVTTQNLFLRSELCYTSLIKKY